MPRTLAEIKAARLAAREHGAQLPLQPLTANGDGKSLLFGVVSGCRTSNSAVAPLKCGQIAIKAEAASLQDAQMAQAGYAASPGAAAAADTSALPRPLVPASAQENTEAGRKRPDLPDGDQPPSTGKKKKKLVRAGELLQQGTVGSFSLAPPYASAGSEGLTVPVTQQQLRGDSSSVHQPMAKMPGGPPAAPEVSAAVHEAMADAAAGGSGGAGRG